jgi:cytochrome o ubiquinol oxidase operon protein cyoD
VSTSTDKHIKQKHGNLKAYLGGFVASLILTLVSYVLVVEKIFLGWSLIFFISFLSLMQAAIQVVFFLNLNVEHRPRWNLYAFLFMLVVVVIVVAGSLWIIFNLNERTMPFMHDHG